MLPTTKHCGSLIAFSFFALMAEADIGDLILCFTTLGCVKTNTLASFCIQKEANVLV